MSFCYKGGTGVQTRIHFFPNRPGNNSEKISNAVTLIITGIDGKQITSSLIDSIEKGNNTLSIVTDNLESGLNILQLYQNEKIIKSFPFVVK